MNDLVVFYTLTNLQGSQTLHPAEVQTPGFTLLQTYKVLKPRVQYQMSSVVLHSYKLTRFSNLLELNISPFRVLHSYKLTRFSNCMTRLITRTLVLHSYKLTRFSNLVQRPEIQRPFYTLTNLQGSQTCRSKLLSRTSFTLLQTYKVLKLSGYDTCDEPSFTLLQTYKVLKPQMRLSPNPNILVICVRYLVMYKTQIFIYQLIIFTFQTFTLVCLN